MSTSAADGATEQSGDAAGTTNASDPRHRRRRRSLLAIAAVALIAVVAGAVAWANIGRDDSGLAAARHEVATGPYRTRVEAAETLAQVTVHLHGEMRRCAGLEVPGVRCAAMGAAAGYAQVLAAHVLRCPPAARHEGRARLSAYLARVEAIDADEARATSQAAGSANQRPPDPPGLPVCPPP